MTEPINDPFSPDPFSPNPISPDPISPDPVSPDPVSPHLVAADPIASEPGNVDPESPTAAVPAKDSSLTPIYAAAGLVEVVATQLRTRLNRGQSQASTLPDTTKSRVAELQQQFRTYRDQVTRGYNSLATRGKPTVDSTLVTVKHLSGRAERKVQDVKSEVAQPPTTDVPEQVVVEPVIVQPVVDVDPDRTPRDF